MIDVIVSRVRDIAHGIRSLELAAADGRALPPFDPGSHIDVHLPDNMVRQYSLCGPAVRVDTYLIAVLKADRSRGGSHSVHALREGDRLVIDGPRNHFALVQGADYSVLLAGGIGVTPLLTMAEHLAAAGQPFEMHYCVRSRPSAAFLDRLNEAASDGRFHLHCDDEAGRALDFAALCRQPTGGKHLYVCGPNGFMDAAWAAAREAGWRDANLHREYFTGAPAPAGDPGSFKVTLARTGLTVTVGADQSIVEALAARGVTVPMSCEQGICGTCVTRVLGGVPEHHDCYFTDEERERGDQITPCCSRAESEELVLDL